MRGTSVGSTGPSQFRESRPHLSTDETTHHYCRRAKPTVGSQHGEYRRNSHVRKDVDPFKSHYLNDRYPEGIAELDRLSASSCHHSSNYRRSLRPEETDHPSAQSTARASLNSSTRVRFFVPPCFFGTKKCFVRGGDVEGASR